MLPVRHSSEGFDEGVANLDRIGGRLSQTALHDLQDYLLDCAPLTGEKIREFEGGAIGSTSG